MKLEYDGYILEIEEIVKGEQSVSYVTHCSFLPFNFPGQWNTDISYVISRFKKAVDRHKKEGVNSMSTQQIIKTEKEMEQEILMKTKGVFKYVTSCYYKDNFSTKNELVQVGYLDLDDNIVFNEPDKKLVSKPDTLVRYLPGFMVKGYRSCEEYVPSTNIKGGGTEIREVISEHTIGYSPSTYGSSPKVTYSVIGYLEDDGELIYYDQITN